MTFKVNMRLVNLLTYLHNHKITDVVIGVSGGIDSAVALNMLVEAKEELPTLNIHALTFLHGIHDNEMDIRDAKTVISPLWDKVDHRVIYISDAVEAVSRPMPKEPTPQIKAQIAYALMYQYMFAYAQTVGGITVGTTNQTEVGFLGWFGKNSDMMTDIQFIHDFYKYEIIAAAKCYNIDESIINKAPTGDLITGETDEEVFGHAYHIMDFLTKMVLDDPAYLKEVEILFPKVWDLHKKNAHKYQGQTFNPVFIGAPLRTVKVG